MKVQYVDEYKESTDSKYKLCILVAKRARELGEYLSAQKNMERINVVKPLVDIESHDPLEIAFNEIKEGKIIFKKKKESI
ncbi:MAG: DNA-directed RNA polymerase subunit omega [Candidatus Hydromicrobium sp.]|jgi:DNA-directed RNA polymerase omega subunit|nr:DNA-directed RNA polymerase subunit omega [Actinomycetota bacterium]MBU4313199.1 DNA-directed RNA polymerase subunit omega [Actinomycetota bacterium]MBU4483678.1 DNA-directed RNA polymerase subunit omega [Actinomycetota bacterium]MCG2790735.1 DNA-directed RNA polymerase subunit omega [Actinomycetes bacterium]MDP3011397.1 DNA-directed RNA polymerase subunit omega [Candidatus Hydromicrobium sp.]